MITAALVGNPNVGKTTLFNLLTGSNQHVGNWPGVTVEKKEGYLENSVRIVDLPGIYAMDTFSNEEKVSKQFIYNKDVDVILNIVDASNLHRNLYLTIQLKTFNKPIVLIVNMIDTANAKGIEIDFKALSSKLGVTVIPISASKGLGIENVKKQIIEGDFLKVLDDSDYHLKSEKETYLYIENILKDCVKLSKGTTITISEKIDRVVLNKFFAYPLFLFLLFIIFKFTFNWVGKPLADGFTVFLNGSVIPLIEVLLKSSSPWFKSLIIKGIIGGVGSVIVFLPIILTLFLGISFLEESGYMARGAFIMDKLLRRMGISGKAFMPLVVGFGCSVPGIMSTRTLESEKDRKLTALLVPLMSCNAKLPVYGLFVAVFFPGRETLVVFSLYLIGIVMAFIMGIIFKNTLFKKDEEPFIIELPEYKLPEFKSLLLQTWKKGKGFLKKAGTIIFSMSVLIWMLSNFNFSGISQINNSFLAYIGSFISPIFKPLGFGSWQNSIALLSGLMAKEVVIGTMGIVYGANLKDILGQYFTSLSAYSFLIFVLLYTPCVSVIGTMKKEYGGKMTLLSVGYQLLLAWIMAFAVFQLGSLFI